MKILHLMLSNYYIDGYNYQENVLPEINRNDGHDVLIIASTETFSEKKKLTYINPGKSFTSTGIPIIRVAYYKYFPLWMAKKIRKYEEWLSIVYDFKPDVILWHGLAAWDLRLLKDIRNKFPSIKIYLDSHEDKYNSARNILSKYILHRCIYKNSLRKAIGITDKIFHVSIEAKKFDIENYNVPEEKLEYYPLGAILINKHEREIRAEKVRRQYNINNNQLLLIHSGKMDRSKKTLDIINAVKEIEDDRIRLLLVGSIYEDIKDELYLLLDSDNRIRYLGWKSTEELLDLLRACDLYLQPGTQSVTLQNALGAAAPVAIFPYESHRPFLNGNGFYVRNKNEIKQAVLTLLTNFSVIDRMRQASFDIAASILDYQKLAARLYQ